MTRGIKYCSYGNSTGYTLSAFAYVRALHNAGVPVWWAPLVAGDGGERPWRPEDGLGALPMSWHAANDATLQDLAALLAATRECPYDTVVAHTVPERWPELFERGKRNVGYTVWETDRLPAHWRSLLQRADRILVPCEMNRRVFAGARLGRPIAVVPHIRRHAWSGSANADGAALREELGIPAGHFLFYSINVWDPRKALADLVNTFARTFCADDRVTLLLKTSSEVSPLAQERATVRKLARHVRALAAAAARATGRSAPHIALLAVDEVAGRVIDAIHATGDCFVSLTHGEGWGMGAFDAATLGKPVLIPSFGGPADYLPPDYPGFVEHAMVPVSGWVPGTSFHAPQRWAQADLDDAGRRMRRMATRYAEFLEPAAAAAERIANRYAEPVIGRRYLAALSG